jgi:hypothetical protein
MAGSPLAADDHARSRQGPGARRRRLLVRDQVHGGRQLCQHGGYHGAPRREAASTYLAAGGYAYKGTRQLKAIWNSATWRQLTSPARRSGLGQL